MKDTGYNIEEYRPKESDPLTLDEFQGLLFGVMVLVVIGFVVYCVTLWPGIYLLLLLGVVCLLATG